MWKLWIFKCCTHLVYAFRIKDLHNMGRGHVFSFFILVCTLIHLFTWISQRNNGLNSNCVSLKLRTDNIWCRVRLLGCLCYVSHSKIVLIAHNCQREWHLVSVCALRLTGDYYKVQTASHAQSVETGSSSPVFVFFYTISGYKMNVPFFVLQIHQPFVCGGGGGV